MNPLEFYFVGVLLNFVIFMAILMGLTSANKKTMSSYFGVFVIMSLFSWSTTTSIVLFFFYDAVKETINRFIDK